LRIISVQHQCQESGRIGRLFLSTQSLRSESLARQLARTEKTYSQSCFPENSTYWQPIGKGGEKWQILAKFGKSESTESEVILTT
jgi:hypothetical protein